MNEKIKLGGHVSFKSPDYFLGSLKQAEDVGANALMIFLGAPQNSRRVSIDKYNVESYSKSYQNLIPIDNMVVHGPYIVNMSNEENFDFNVDFLISEIKRMEHIKINKLVMHPGSRKKLSNEEALSNTIKVLNAVLEKTPNSKVKIYLETMSGKGSEICSNLNDLEFIINKVNSPRIGICLDTCHLWDAGYDLKNEWKAFLEDLKNRKMIDKVGVVHLNDSKNELSSHKDRHETPGKGKLGLEAMRTILFSKELRDSVFILESPWYDDKIPYKEEINLLKNKIEGK